MKFFQYTRAQKTKNLKPAPCNRLRQPAFNFTLTYPADLPCIFLSVSQPQDVIT